MPRSFARVGVPAVLTIVGAGLLAAAPGAGAAPGSPVASPRAGQVVHAPSVRIALRAGAHPRAIAATLNGVPVGDQFGPRRDGLRQMTASVSAGLQRGTNVLRVTVRRRHGAPRRATVRFTVRTKRHMVGAGLDRQIAVGSTVTLAGIVRRANGARSGGRTGWKLVSATSAGRLGSAGGRSATFRPRQPGRFTLELAAGRGATRAQDRVTLTAVPGALVPIDTQAGTAARPAIKVGSTTYAADPPAGTHGVAQVLVLTRASLDLVSAMSYGDAMLSQIPDALAKLDDSDLAIVSYRSVDGSTPADMSILKTIGVDAPKEKQATFAAIGVNGMKAGQADQLAGLGQPQDPGMTGYLTRDQNLNYRYASPERVPFSFPPSPVTCATCTPQVGFEVKVYDPRRPGFTPVQQDLFTTGGHDGNVTLDTAYALSMIDRLNAIPQGWPVTVVSLSAPESGGELSEPAVGSIDGQVMNDLATAIARVGGNRDAFFRAATQSSDPKVGARQYALVGWGGATPGDGAEAAAGIDGTPSVPTLAGVLRPNRQGELRPSAVSGEGDPGEALTDRVMASPSDDWQCGAGTSCKDAPKVAAAIAYIGTQVPQLGSDPRAAYGVSGWSAAVAQSIAGLVGDVTYPSSAAGFGADDFATAKQQSRRELGWIANVREYFDAQSAPFTDSGLTNYVNVHKIADAVYESANAPDDDTAFRWLDFTKIVLKLVGPLTGEGTADIAELIDLGQWIAGNGASGASTYDEVNIKADELGTEVTAQAQTVEELRRIGDIIVSDPQKLAFFGTWANCAATDPKCPAGLSSSTQQRREATTAYARGIERLAYETLMPLGYAVYALSQAAPGDEASRYTGVPRDIHTYFCKAYHPFVNVPAAATATVVDGVAPGGTRPAPRAFQAYVLARIAGSTDTTAVPPPDPILSRMFGRVSSSLDPADGGLGIEPTLFMAQAQHAYWQGSQYAEASERGFS